MIKKIFNFFYLNRLTLRSLIVDFQVNLKRLVIKEAF